MAQKTIVTLTDDIDGSNANRTMTFSFNGTNYEIDLNDTHAQDLTTALEPFIGAARKLGRERSQSGTSKTDRSDKAAAVRGWARDQGMEVSARGRVSHEVMTAYQQRD